MSANAASTTTTTSLGSDGRRHLAGRRTPRRRFRGSASFCRSRRWRSFEHRDPPIGGRAGVRADAILRSEHHARAGRASAARRRCCLAAVRQEAKKEATKCKAAAARLRASGGAWLPGAIFWATNSIDLFLCFDFFFASHTTPRSSSSGFFLRNESSVGRDAQAGVARQKLRGGGASV